MQVCQARVKFAPPPFQQGIRDGIDRAPVRIGWIERDGVEAAPIVQVGNGPGGGLAEFEFHAEEGIENLRPPNL